MNILTDTKNLIEILEKVKENTGLNKNSHSGSIFNSLEVRKGSATYDANNESKPIVTKSKKYYFRISFLKGSIQYLDIKSSLNLSLVNKEFNYFIKSIYFYKFMSDINIFRQRKSKKSNIRKEIEKVTPIKSNNKGFVGNFVGALGSVLGKTLL